MQRTDDADRSWFMGPVEVVAVRDPVEFVLGTRPLDAVVSSDDSLMTMSGGVSEVLARLAGPDMVAHARRGIPYPVGTVVTTPAGDLPAAYVLHAITMDLRKKEFVPTERTLLQLAREVLVRCEALHIRRICVPAIATGAAGFAVARAARLVVDALREHVQNETDLEQVVFTLPYEDGYLAFVDELTAARSSPSNEYRARLGTVVYEEAPAPLEATDALPPAPEAPPAEPVASVRRDWRAWWPFGRRSRHSATTVDRRHAPAADVEPGSSPELSALDVRPTLSRRYVLLEQIGRGGMGIVHLAWDLVLRKTVAVKMLRAELAGLDAVDLLRREAAIAMDLTHDSIVRFFHFELHELFGPYIVMEYLDWIPGEKWIAASGANRLPVDSVIAVGMQLCDALAYAHDRGFLHNDIKPNNVFVDPAGERAKLADFGLSRAFSRDSGRLLMLEPSGTPAYMAPEQRTPGAKLGPFTDVYQLGATMWDFLTGIRPDRRRALPDGIEDRRRQALAIAGLALASDPAERPADARAFGNMLQRAGR